MTKTTFYGDNLEGMVKAANAARNYLRVNGMPSLGVIGFQIEQKYYSVKFNKAGVAVWENKDD